MSEWNWAINHVVAKLEDIAVSVEGNVDWYTVKRCIDAAKSASRPERQERGKQRRINTGKISGWYYRTIKPASGPPEFQRTATSDRRGDSQLKGDSMKVTDEMVNRFLSWPLPENFNPDAGISFKAEFNEHTAYPMKHKPVGTNLLDAGQARAMLEYVLREPDFCDECDWIRTHHPACSKS